MYWRRSLTKTSERPEIVVGGIDRLVLAKEYNLAQSFIQQWSATMADRTDFQVAWALFVVAKNDPASARGLFENQIFRPDDVLTTAPHTYIRLLKLADRRKELEATLHNSLNHSVESQDPEDLSFDRIAVQGTRSIRHLSE